MEAPRLDHDNIIKVAATPEKYNDVNVWKERMKDPDVYHNKLINLKAPL